MCKFDFSKVSTDNMKYFSLFSGVSGQVQLAVFGTRTSILKMHHGLNSTKNL